MGPVERNGSTIPFIRVWWDDLKPGLETTVSVHDRQISYSLVEGLELILYNSAGLNAHGSPSILGTKSVSSMGVTSLGKDGY